MSDLFTYNNGSSVIPADTFRISPSQINKFFDSTNEWYRTMLLDEAGFQGNTATHLGTCVHAAAETYITTGSIDHTAITAYINSITDPEVDKQVIIEQWPVMANRLVAYLSTFNPINPTCEQFVVAEVTDKVVVGGSIDLYSDNLGGIITDYKTMGSLDKARLPKKVPRNYWFQQMTYAWALRKLGKPVNYFQLIYVTRSNTGRFNDKGKPLKDYPSEIHVLKEPVTEESLAIIEDILKLIAESVTLWKSNPEYQHLLAQDYRLRKEPPRKLFK